MPTLAPTPPTNSSTPAYGGETSAGADPEGMENQLAIEHSPINIDTPAYPEVELNTNGATQ
jgi:hypothetical protein